MLVNLGLATLLVSISVLIHSLGLLSLSHSMERIIQWFSLHRHGFGKNFAMVATVLGIFLIHTVEIWAWAVLYLATGALTRFQDALYFSTATFATLGYGNFSLSPEWRLLGSIEGIDGFILIGWSTAFLVAASTRFGPFRSGEHF
jgi:hypothetical protein